MAHHTIQTLAAYSTIKGIADNNTFKNQYLVLAEFIKCSVLERHMLAFNTFEIIRFLKEDYDFDIPYAVVKSSLNRIPNYKRNKDDYTVHGQTIISTEFSDLNKKAESDGASVIEKLIGFVRERHGSIVAIEQLESDFIMYILDRTDAQNLKYGDEISSFCLSVENDLLLQKKIDAIREGSVLYCGLCYNIIETGSVTDEITLYLDTEVLFYLAGYDGELSKKIALDFMAQVRAANSKSKRVHLSYFNEVEQEVNRYFNAARNIVSGKTGTITSRAMSAIVNGCEKESDVLDKQTDFYYLLNKTYCIYPDKHSKDYYLESNYVFNLASAKDFDIDDAKTSESVNYISHINVLRKGETYTDYTKCKYLLVSETRKLHEISNAFRCEGKCGYSLTISRITNILWLKMGGAFGKDAFPYSVSVAVKARVALDGSIASSANKTFNQTLALYKEGKINEEQASLRILRIQEKITEPENLTFDKIDDLLDFSPEAIQKYEQAYQLGERELQLKERIITDLKKQMKSSEDELSTMIRNNQQKDEIIKYQEAELQIFRDKELSSQARKKRILRLLKKILLSILIILLSLIIILILGLLPDNSIVKRVLQSIVTLFGIYGTVCTIWPNCNVFSGLIKNNDGSKRKTDSSGMICFAVMTSADVVLLFILIMIIKYIWPTLG